MDKIKIISGGQTGVDQGALDFALDHGYECGGFCPRGRKSEKGIIPYRYPVSEIESEEYIDRTKRNILESDGTLIIRDAIEIQGGVLDTIHLCTQFSKTYLIINISEEFNNEEVVKWISFNKIKTLNIAGNRESINPGLRSKTYLYLVDLFNV